MDTYQAELLIDTECAIAECPVYDEEKHGLYWLDIQKNRIYYLDLTSCQCLYTQMDRKIGSIVPTDSGRFLAGMDDGIYLVDGLTYAPYCWVPESIFENIRFNDGKCDPQGRFVVGTSATPNYAGQGFLISVGAKGNYQMLYPGLGCSNGLAWTEDGKIMYHVDTLVSIPSYIAAVDYDPETGAVSNRRPAINFSKEAAQGILADGMAIDRDGNLWIAEWNGYGVGCWNPKTGEKIAKIQVPAAKVSSCAFGGKDYQTLYITTAAGDGEHAGGIFAAKVDAIGYPAVKFRE